MAFSSDSGTAAAGGDQAAAGSNRLDILMRSLGRKRHRRQAASLPGGDSALRASQGGLQQPQPHAAGGAPAARPPGSRVLFITFGNTAFFDFTHNWVLSVKRLGVPFVVGALDKGMSEKCAAHGFPVLDLWTEVRTGLAHSGPQQGGSWLGDRWAGCIGG